MRSILIDWLHGMWCASIKFEMSTTTVSVDERCRQTGQTKNNLYFWIMSDDEMIFNRVCSINLHDWVDYFKLKKKPTWASWNSSDFKINSMPPQDIYLLLHEPYGWANLIHIEYISPNTNKPNHENNKWKILWIVPWMHSFTQIFCVTTKMLGNV